MIPLLVADAIVILAFISVALWHTYNRIRIILLWKKLKRDSQPVLIQIAIMRDLFLYNEFPRNKKYKLLFNKYISSLIASFVLSLFIISYILGFRNWILYLFF